MSQKVCPACSDRRPAEEVFCQNVVDGSVCGWDLTSVTLDVPVASMPAESGQAPRCPNGHAVNPGDLLCGVCDAAIELPREGESSGSGPEIDGGDQQPHDPG